mmetsp:Transcript_14838/g.30588  ORF Transcript_14838/g.30588 Transcript_14838/m.30588 type:complete len:80 (+) Transcript_14838:72-311(+)
MRTADGGGYGGPLRTDSSGMETTIRWVGDDRCKLLSPELASHWQPRPLSNQHGIKDRAYHTALCWGIRGGLKLGRKLLQ